MIHTDEDDEFDRIKRENAMREVQRLGQEIEESGQPYFFEGVFVSVSQRNQVLEECAQQCEKFGYENFHGIVADQIAKVIRGMKK
jgi:hypothetical protein